MQKPRRTLLLLVLVSFACGGEDPSGGGIPGGGAAGGTSAPVYGEMDPDLVRLQDWELYASSPSRHARLVGQAVDPDGSPVPHARVTLAYRCDLPILPPRLGESFVADEKGVFELRDVPLNALLFVEKEGFGGRMVPTLGHLPVKEGMPSVFLVPGSSISGFVHFEDGSPAPGVDITLSCPMPDWFRVVQTDTRGRFAADDVPAVPLVVAPVPGRIFAEPQQVVFEEGVAREVDLLVVRKPGIGGSFQDAVTGAPIPGGIVRSLAGRSEVAAVADLTGRFRLDGVHLPMFFALAPGFGERPIQWDPAGEAGEDLLITLERGGCLRGRVVDPRGAPLAGYRVMGLVGIRGPGSRLRGPLTREDGSFEYSWVLLPREGSEVALLANADGVPLAVGPVVFLRRGQVISDLEFVVPDPCRVTVRAVDDAGVPRGYVGVSLEEEFPADVPDGLRNYAHHSEASAGADGVAILTGIRPGIYRLTVWANDRLPLSTQVTVAGGEEVSLPDVVCPIGYTLKGIVTSVGGEFEAPPRVFLVDPESGDRIPVYVEGDGRFEISGLEDRPYGLQCSAADHEPVARNSTPGEGELRIRLRALGRLKVTVTSEEELPPEGTIEVVSAKPTGPAIRPWKKRLEGDGSIVDFNPLPPGDYFVRVTAEGQVGAAQVQVSPASETSLNMVLTTAGYLKGRVLGPRGEVEIDIGVEVDAGKSWGSKGIRTDDRGTFRSPALPSGEVVVRSHPFGHPPTEKTVVVGAGQETEVDLELADGATVDLTVTDMDGEAMEGVTIALHDAGGEQARYWIEGRGKAVTNADGKIKLLGVPPGRYLLTFLVGGDWRERMSIDLAEGETWNNEDVPVKLER